MARVLPTNSFSMFNLWAGGGGEFGTRDTGFRRVRRQFIQPLEADALTSPGGAINGAGDSIANSRRQFREDAVDIVAHVPCNMRTQLEGFDGVGDCWTINAA